MSAAPESSIRPISQCLPQVVDRLQSLYNSRGSFTGLPTGLRGYDKLTSGLHKSELVLVAGASGVGKTALVLNIVEHVALREKLPVGILSPEWSSESVLMRMLTASAQLDFENVSAGCFKKSDVSKLNRVGLRMQECSIFIDDTPNLDIADLCRASSQMKDDHGIHLLVIDSLDCITDRTHPANGDRRILMSDIVKRIKQLTQELDLPIVLTAHMGSPNEASVGGVPLLSTLKSNGSIDRYADVVTFLVRPAVGPIDPEKSDCLLAIAKQDKGPTGEAKLVFDATCLRFGDKPECETAEL